MLCITTKDGQQGIVFLRLERDIRSFAHCCERTRKTWLMGSLKLKGKNLHCYRLSDAHTREWVSVSFLDVFSRVATSHGSNSNSARSRHFFELFCGSWLDNFFSSLGSNSLELEIKARKYSVLALQYWRLIFWGRNFGFKLKFYYANRPLGTRKWYQNWNWTSNETFL